MKRRSDYLIWVGMILFLLIAEAVLMNLIGSAP